MSRAAVFAATCFLGASAIGGCAAGPPAEPETPAETSEAKDGARDEGAADDGTPEGQIHRADLDAVLQRGPAWVLNRVQIEEVLAKGKFVGWRVMSLPPEWQEIALQPGDVVTHVNAMPIERPSEFFAAWTTLSVASELKISYRRGEAEHELAIPVFGEPDPEMLGRLQEKPEEAPPATGPKRKPTIVIRSEDRPLTTTVVQ